MRIENLVNSFPELNHIDEQSRLELLENARYETFIRPGSNSVWAFGYVILFLGAVGSGILISVILKLFLEPSGILIGATAGVVATSIGLYSQRRWYIRMLSSKVRELSSDKRFNNSSQQTEDTAAE